ncbi:MAG: hypothetical protein WCI53_13620 [Bacteroidota bacterium]|jgi:hypothetical protein
MKKIKVYLFTFFVFFVLAASANCSRDSLAKKSTFNVGIEGAIGFSVGKDFYAFNVGGPSLNLRVTNDLKIGVGALPSFYFKNGKPGARLGVAPKLGYKKISLYMPSYFFDSTGKWIITVGLGYTFSK